jgi:D-amino-acid dehydrogenase
VISNDKSFTGDAYVLAGGAWSAGIAKLAGLKYSNDAGQGLFFYGR